MTDRNPLFGYKTPARGVESPFPRPPEPDFLSDESIDDGLDEDEPNPEVYFDKADLHPRDLLGAPISLQERFAIYAALGLKPKTIAEKLGVDHKYVCQALRSKALVGRAIYHRRQFVEKAKHRVITSLNTALEKLPKHMALEVGAEDPKEHAFELRKKCHELDAIKFAIETGLSFIQSDHALGKVEEKLFGPKTPAGGPLVQINQQTEQPTLSSRAVEILISKLPIEQRKPVIDKLLENRVEIEAELAP